MRSILNLHSNVNYRLPIRQPPVTAYAHRGANAGGLPAHPTRSAGWLRNTFILAAPTREKMVELLAAQITDPTSVQMAYQEVVDYTTQAEDAIRLLLREHGEMTEAQFSRDFGAIRQMGPAKLDRESPWLYPESVAELLYYYGLLGRGFKGAGQRATTIVYVPSDMAPWLPHPQSEAAAAGLPVKPVAPPPVARLILANDTFLEDAGTLLGLRLHRPPARHPAGPHPEDVDRLVQRLQMPFGAAMPNLEVRLALLLHLANRLHWLRRDGEAIQLTQNPVAAFLDKTRTEQRQALFEAWRSSPDWNDLCRTPSWSAPTRASGAMIRCKHEMLSCACRRSSSLDSGIARST